MKVEYIREICDCFMQIVPENEAWDYRMKMIENNHPEGFLKMTVRTVDGVNRMLYRISSCVAMEDYLIKKDFSWEDMNNLIKSFMAVFDSVENYMMDYDGVILNPEHIYTDGRGKWMFAYYSGKETNFYEDIKLLFEYIIRHVDHKDVRGVTAAYGIYKRICEGNINPENLFDMEIVEEEEGIVEKEYKPIQSIIPEICTQETEEKDYTKIYALYVGTGIYAIVLIYVIMGIFISGIRIGNIGKSIYIFLLILLISGGIAAYRWFEHNKSLFVRVTTKQVEVPFEKTDIRVVIPAKSPDNEFTTILTEEPINTRHFLKWSDSGGYREYELNDKITIIGSASDRADCVISEKGISRVHARISNEDLKYYIKDMNSTNGTRVNGKELACYEICEIRTNDRIELGNKECIFI